MKSQERGFGKKLFQKRAAPNIELMTENYQEMDEKGLSPEQKKHRKGCITAIVIVMIVFVGFFYLMYKTAVPVSYTSFNKERIEMIEQKYKVSLDNTVPVRYWVPALAQDSDSCFNFYTDDPAGFMDSFYGEAILKSYLSPDKDESSYTCHVGGYLCFTVRFEASDSKKGAYSGKLVAYTDKITYSSTVPSQDGNAIIYSEK